MRKLFFWKLKQRELRLGDRTLLMGVLNVTPDSFSDGGKYAEPDRAFARAVELEEMGADIIDIGAESTRPGSARISAAEEIRRLIPVLKRLKGQLGVPISVDTYKAEVAERALDLGVEIINDPSGLTWEPQLARVVSNFDAGLVLNHMRGRPETWAKLAPMPDPISTIGRDLDAAISRARRVGIDRTRMVVDPGLGFGKRKEQNALDHRAAERIDGSRSAHSGRSFAQAFPGPRRPGRNPFRHRRRRDRLRARRRAPGAGPRRA